MLEQIDGYFAKRIDLNHIRVGLKALLSALEATDAGWKSSFIQSWGVLEVAYANMVYKQLNELPPQEQAQVDDAIRVLKSLVEGQLASVSP